MGGDTSEWVYAGAEERGRDAGTQRQVREMLARAGYGERNDRDVRVDLICGRGAYGEAQSSIKVWVTKDPRPAQPKRKPRHKT